MVGWGRTQFFSAFARWNAGCLNAHCKIFLNFCPISIIFLKNRIYKTISGNAFLWQEELEFSQNGKNFKFFVQCATQRSCWLCCDLKAKLFLRSSHSERVTKRRTEKTFLLKDNLLMGGVFLCIPDLICSRVRRGFWSNYINKTFHWYFR